MEEDGVANFLKNLLLHWNCAIMLSARRGPFGRFYSGKEAPKPRWDRNNYACGIISDCTREEVYSKLFLLRWLRLPH